MFGGSSAGAEEVSVMALILSSWFLLFSGTLLSIVPWFLTLKALSSSILSMCFFRCCLVASSLAFIPSY